MGYGKGDGIRYGAEGRDAHPWKGGGNGQSGPWGWSSSRQGGRVRVRLSERGVA